MNNMGREIMAALKRFQTGSDGDGVTVGGALVVSGSTTVNTFNVDVISEKTSAAGVTIDGVLLKDSLVGIGANGSASAPAIYRSNDTNTGIFFPAADTIAFAEGGAEAMRIDSGGNVGIGTTTPFGTTSTRTVLSINGTNDSLITMGVGNVRKASFYHSGTNMLVVNDANGYLGLSTNDTERMRIHASGGLSLNNTTDPGVGTIRVTGRYLAGSTGVSTPDYSFAADGSMGMYRVPGSLCFATGGTERMRITSAGEVLVGKTTTSIGDAGQSLFGSGATQITRDAGTPFFINRLTDDGLLVALYGQGVVEGNISVSGSTVSYNGGHLSRWAQMLTKPDLLKGTVMSNLDEMNVYIAPTTYWTEDDELPEGVNVGDVKVETHEVENEQLNKVKVSDVEGDANVAGVFVNWDYDEAHQVDEINMAMTGDMIIRIAQGTTVARGDLLMSAGDGTAKPQGDDIVRSKTIAKVTSTHVTCTYDDGSYCVPCVLMAC
jgi:hypothetical protein